MVILRQGEKVLLRSGQDKYEGVFVKEDDLNIFIKLKSGYNLGVSKASISEVKSVDNSREEKNLEKEKMKPMKQDKSLPTISLLHTGGTIASRVDYETGAVTAKFTPEEILIIFPELTRIANIKSRLISNMMSENIRFHHYNVMAQAVEEEIRNGAQGVIITHGTDTLHYTGAALSFALKNVQIPVMIIGSQRSSDRPSTDSAINLLSAATFITKTSMAGVFICMHEDINDDKCIVIEGVNARKMHTSRRDAFRPINKTPVARVNYATKKVEVIRPYPAPQGEFTVKPFDEKVKVGLVKVHPQMYAEELSPYDSFDGLIIETTGLGQAQIIAFDDKSIENEKIMHALSRIAKKIPVAASPQTIYGRVNMNVYSEGRKLMDLGVLGNYCDMTPETAFIKLAWLISNHSTQEVKEFYDKNLRGEISERSEKETFLI
ncbi:Glu-tRNA(Gln) amidotransferase subunit GatD [Candidatus Woesearchaeota archaeon]|nr:Glu-tRNA(Gln) amidotransferase subunit GatD [Candidatus Woesearchaeota archaeon]